MPFHANIPALYLVVVVVVAVVDENNLLGELQFCFICFLIGHGEWNT